MRTEPSLLFLLVLIHTWIGSLPSKVKISGSVQIPFNLKSSLFELRIVMKTQKLHFHRTKCIRELEYIRRMRRNRAVTGRLIRGIGGALGVKTHPLAASKPSAPIWRQGFTNNTTGNLEISEKPKYMAFHWITWKYICRNLHKYIYWIDLIQLAGWDYAHRW